ncbi:hypothetical protein [Micromonospora sp. CB01531]|uniref:hypothetical protein n=1 Tax=Micromonospora sp. CB01531 TaxID=1718947 RepID=UPI0011610EE2|nr:hypothetical protein [Micromonospora sp. CB01531]
MTANDEHPEITPEADGDLERIRRNETVLEAVQVSLGLIGPDVLGIAVESRSDGVTFHVALARRTAEADEDIEDMIADYEARTLGYVPSEFTIDAAVTVEDTGPQWRGRRWSVIYLAHPSIRRAATASSATRPDAG